MRSANLIPARRREAKARLARLRAWAVLLAAYLPAAGAGYAVCLAYGDDGTEARLRRMQEATAELRTLGRQMQSARLAAADTSRKLAAVRAMRKHPDWGLLLAMLSDSLGEEVVLERCALSAADASGPAPVGEPAAAKPAEPQSESGGYRLEIRGHARTQRGVSQFVLRLEKAGLFDRVRLVKTSRQPFLDAEAIAFQVECLLGAQRGMCP